MIKIGITGQSGFIGTHLYNTLRLHPDKYNVIPFQDTYFEQERALKHFVEQCDVIVHLAGMNRHPEPAIIYETNIRLTRQLITACQQKKATPHILFASSTQEELDNPYGRSKRESRMLLEQWADKNDAQFTGLVIPNVFGPFGRPNYNSVVATFCHQLTHGEHPQIDIDGNLKLLYVTELVDQIIEKIEEVERDYQGKVIIQQIQLQHTTELSVSGLLKILEGYKSEYFEKGVIPALHNPSYRKLFSTFLCYIDHARFFPFQLKVNTDNRGDYVELVKALSGGQVSFSSTRPGITRGNHFHTRKAERFVVIRGQATIQLRRIGTDQVLAFTLDGSRPAFVDMPVWYTHNITNTGQEELITLFWASEFFDPANADTYVEQV